MDTGDYAVFREQGKDFWGGVFHSITFKLGKHADVVSVVAGRDDALGGGDIRRWMAFSLPEFLAVISIKE